MPEIGFGIKKPHAGLYILCSKLCGRPVYKLLTSVRLEERFMRRLSYPLRPAYAKVVDFTQFNTQLALFLCTVFQHYYTTAAPVVMGFIRTIHRVYKNNDNLNKGLII